MKGQGKLVKKCKNSDSLSQNWLSNQASKKKIPLIEEFVNLWGKTCSCPLVRYFRMLLWDDIKIIWNENMIYFFNWEKNIFWTNKIFFYLIFINKLWWYHPQIMYENFVQEDMNKFFVNWISKWDRLRYS